MTRANDQPYDPKTAIALLTIKLNLRMCFSLKEKRGRLKPLLNAVKREFNVSVSEIGLQDMWQSSWIGCVILSTDITHNMIVLNKITHYLQDHFPDEEIVDQRIERC